MQGCLISHDAPVPDRLNILQESGTKVRSFKKKHEQSDSEFIQSELQ